MCRSRRGVSRRPQRGCTSTEARVVDQSWNFCRLLHRCRLIWLISARSANIQTVKSFVREHGRAIAVMTVVSYLAAVLAGGSMVAVYAATITCLTIWLWREARKGTFD